MARKVVAMGDRLLAVMTTDLSSVNVSVLCRELGISRQSFYKYRRRFTEEGPAGLVERSRRPLSSPNQMSAGTEDRIVELRKRRQDAGEDCGAQSIVWQMVREGWPQVPSAAAAHRALVRRGQVTPQPQKRPRSATRRFVWPFPNDAWQIDATRWVLSDGEEVWIMDCLDDHSRVVPAAVAGAGPTTRAAWDTLCVGAESWGLPAGFSPTTAPVSPGGSWAEAVPKCCSRRTWPPPGSATSFPLRATPRPVGSWNGSTRPSSSGSGPVPWRAASPSCKHSWTSSWTTTTPTVLTGPSKAPPPPKRGRRRQLHNPETPSPPHPTPVSTSSSLKDVSPSGAT